MAQTNQITEIAINPIDWPIPVEPDFPIGGPTPEVTIKVEGDTKAGVAELSTDVLLPASNPIEGTDRADILFSTPGNDLVLAKGGDDTIIGSLGDDIIDGGDGFDTLDYTQLGRKITLLPQGLIGNGDTRGSQIQSIERIVGAPKKDNTIDGSGGKGPVFFTVDLSKNQLIVENIPRLGSVPFVVENFVNVEGTQNSDFIIGDNKNNQLSGNGGNDTLIGLFGNDTLNGGSGNDTLTGADPNVQNTVRPEKDVLTGGTGGDNFVLGNKSGSFYDDFGNKDFAKITDFSFGDQINLGALGKGESYSIIQNKGGFNIFLVEDFGRDLIGKVAYSFAIAEAKTTITENGSMSSASAMSMAISSDALLGDTQGEFTTINFELGGIEVA